MSISFTGLDLDFLKDPANHLPPRPKVKKRRAPNKRSSTVQSPYFMADISPFISPVGEKPVVISSRKQLRDHEVAYNMRQSGNDFKPGSIASKNEAKRQAREELAKGVESGWADL